MITIQYLRVQYPLLAALAEKQITTLSPIEGEDEISFLFVWHKTPQGKVFWSEVDKGIRLQEKEDELSVLDVKTIVNQKFED